MAMMLAWTGCFYRSDSPSSGRLGIATQAGHLMEDVLRPSRIQFLKSTAVCAENLD